MSVEKLKLRQAACISHFKEMRNVKLTDFRGDYDKGSRHINFMALQIEVTQVGDTSKVLVVVAL
mgnify:CR=1 FL=1